ELLHSSLRGNIWMTAAANLFLQSLTARFVSTLVSPNACRNPAMCRPALTSLTVDVTGNSPSGEQIADRTPCSPDSIDINTVIDPIQCASICTVAAFVTSLTFATAAG